MFSNEDECQLEVDRAELVPEPASKQAEQTRANDSAKRCSHEHGESRSCNLCEEIVSPPRLRPPGLLKADREGVGTGHGRKVPAWCSNRDMDSIDNDVENIRDDDDKEYRRPRIRNDRKQSDSPPKRITRCSGLEIVN
jgi:hypothetical protein